MDSFDCCRTTGPGSRSRLAAGERPEPQEVPTAKNSRGGPCLGGRDCPFLEARVTAASSRGQLSLHKEVDSGGGHTGAEEACSLSRAAPWSRASRSAPAHGTRGAHTHVGMSGSCLSPSVASQPTEFPSFPDGISDPPDVPLWAAVCSRTTVQACLCLLSVSTWPGWRKDREMSLNEGVRTKEGRRKGKGAKEGEKVRQKEETKKGRKERKAFQLILGCTQVQAC